jgi:hypothetical protein
MGSRTNFIVKQGEGVYVTLYSHWGGDSKMKDLAYALKKAEPRWGDVGYATRILFNALQSDHDSQTGYGIYGDSTGGEESYDHTVIDFDAEIVYVNNHPIKFNTFIEAYSEVKENA